MKKIHQRDLSPRMDLVNGKIFNDFFNGIYYGQFRKEKRVELKSLLGNSLGSYWNDGSMMVDKRRRKQVVRYTTEDE